FNGSVESLVIDPSHPSTLYAGTDTGVYKSVDNGVTWQSSSQGLQPPAGAYYYGLGVNQLAIDPSNPATLYALTNFGIFKGPDGAGNWPLANGNLPADVIILAQGISRITPLAVAPTASGTGEALYVGTQYQGVFSSLDGGTTWTNASKGLPTFFSFYFGPEF